MARCGGDGLNFLGSAHLEIRIRDGASSVPRAPMNFGSASLPQNHSQVRRTVLDSSQSVPSITPVFDLDPLLPTSAIARPCRIWHWLAWSHRTG
jgi:hypothetical protein